MLTNCSICKSQIEVNRNYKVELVTFSPRLNASRYKPVLRRSYVCETCSYTAEAMTDDNTKAIISGAFQYVVYSLPKLRTEILKRKGQIFEERGKVALVFA